MKNKILVLLFSATFLLTSCSNDEVATNTTTSTEKTGPQNTTNSEFDELIDPGLGEGGWGDCTNSYTLTGSCTQQGNFSGFFKFDDCNKYRVTFSHNNQTITGLNVTLPAAANGVSYSFITPKAWTYNASTQQFIITIPIKKTSTQLVYPPNSTSPPTPVTTITNFYKTLMVNTCTSTVLPS